ncbi:MULTISPECIES: ribonuclease D [Dyella]|uniref:Ribonuclease D n=2 Tax=Dyella TaxID=231454 RepID=A0A4R0YZE9_9GAMM|nr:MULTISPECIES: HRDC domain-containing protein [Dyella]TBR39694.1 ribonuclease D [Dyella terrae]TCI12724.1 ribonuclease D [Dyella soli]
MQLPVTPAADWITSRAALDQWLAAVPADAALDLDTEFMRRNTFYPQLALLQLGWNDRYALVDPLAFSIGDALRPLLGDIRAMTVMHSASEDLESLAPLLPQGPATLFDTQIAAAFVGLGLGLSYRALVAEFVGVELDKGETRSDWLQRPLTESQRAYATLDVVYLTPIREQLAERLLQRGRAAWHHEDCERLKRRSCGRESDPQPQENFRGAAEWKPGQQALLRRILLWRDRTARTLDRPRPWLLEDALVMNLAQQPPRLASDLEQRTRGQRALRGPQRHELFDLIAAPVSDQEIAETTSIAGSPQGDEKKSLAAMKDVVDRTAQELDLPPGLLCARKTLEEFVVTRRWPTALEGWRDGILRQPLTSLLSG